MIYTGPHYQINDWSIRAEEGAVEYRLEHTLGGRADAPVLKHGKPLTPSGSCGASDFTHQWVVPHARQQCEDSSGDADDRKRQILVENICLTWPDANADITRRTVIDILNRRDSIEKHAACAVRAELDERAAIRTRCGATKRSSAMSHQRRKRISSPRGEVNA